MLMLFKKVSKSKGFVYNWLGKQGYGMNHSDP